MTRAKQTATTGRRKERKVLGFCSVCKCSLSGSSLRWTARTFRRMSLARVLPMGQEQANNRIVRGLGGEEPHPNPSLSFSSVGMTEDQGFQDSCQLSSTKKSDKAMTVTMCSSRFQSLFPVTFLRF